jgi:hypothetical protein
MSSMDAEKGYAIEMENHGEYLYAIVGGLRVTTEIALGYWREIIDECEELGISKILLEHNFVEMISMQEMLEVIGPVADLLKGRRSPSLTGTAITKFRRREKDPSWPRC